MLGFKINVELDSIKASIKYIWALKLMVGHCVHLNFYLVLGYEIGVRSWVQMIF
jgi:hypothetical protein